MQNKKLDHINIVVPDLKEAMDWYQNVMKFTLKAEFKSPSGMRFVYLENDGVVYELFEDNSLTKSVVDHIAYVSENIQADHRFFTEQGLTPTSINFIDFLWDNGVEYFFIESPSNERIEFCQKK